MCVQNIIKKIIFRIQAKCELTQGQKKHLFLLIYSPEMLHLTAQDKGQAVHQHKSHA